MAFTILEPNDATKRAMDLKGIPWRKQHPEWREIGEVKEVEVLSITGIIDYRSIID